MNFPLRIALPVSHRFWVVVTSFSLVSRYLLIFSLISLTYSLFNNMLFRFHVFAYFSVFSLWSISSFIALWSEKMLDMIWVFSNWLRLVLCPSMWSILENIPCALEKCVYSALGWNTLKISIQSIWSSVLFKAASSLLIYCLKDLSIEGKGVLKSLNMNLFLLISPFTFIKIYFTNLGAPMLHV